MPCTVALHCDAPLTVTEAGVHVTATEVMVDAEACTVTEAVPDLLASSLLVAVTVTVPADAGAVNTPLEEMAPPLADHVTAEL